MWLRRVTHSGAYNLVEHPYRDLAIVALVVIIHLTAKHALRSGLTAADNDISSGQRMPPILHPPDIRLVIILIGTCTTARVPTYRLPRTHLNRVQSNSPSSVALLPCLRSVAFTTATLAAPPSFSAIAGGVLRRVLLEVTSDDHLHIPPPNSTRVSLAPDHVGQAGGPEAQPRAPVEDLKHGSNNGQRQHPPLDYPRARGRHRKPLHNAPMDRALRRGRQAQHRAAHRPTARAAQSLEFRRRRRRRQRALTTVLTTDTARQRKSY